MSVQIVDRPYLFPQRCFFTGDGTERPLIDTGVNDTDGGRVYISLDFVADIARAAGYVTLAEAEELRSDLANATTVAAIIPTAIKELTVGITDLASRTVVDLLSRVPDSPVDVPPAPVAPAGAAKGAKPARDDAAGEQGRPRL